MTLYPNHIYINRVIRHFDCDDGFMLMECLYVDWLIVPKGEEMRSRYESGVKEVALLIRMNKDINGARAKTRQIARDWLTDNPEWDLCAEDKIDGLVEAIAP